jgi:membrane protein implicated in regulation of membrane protease activity
MRYRAKLRYMRAPLRDASHVVTESLIGSQGTVTVAIRGQQGPGEVEVSLDGGTETYIAHSDQPIAKGMTVVIFETRPGRRVDVSPVGL